MLHISMQTTQPGFTLALYTSEQQDPAGVMAEVGSRLASHRRSRDLTQWHSMWKFWWKELQVSFFFEHFGLSTLILIPSVHNIHLSLFKGMAFGSVRGRRSTRQTLPHSK
jgi:hypothetical protein